jgi:hypothetical protein
MLRSFARMSIGLIVVLVSLSSVCAQAAILAKGKVNSLYGDGSSTNADSLARAPESAGGFVYIASFLANW